MYVKVTNWIAGNIVGGSQTVTTSGTCVALGSAECYRVHIRANSDNTGIVAVGGSAVTASPVTGVFLEAAESLTLDVDNLSKVYIDASIDGEGVSFTYEAV